MGWLKRGTVRGGEKGTKARTRNRKEGDFGLNGTDRARIGGWSQEHSEQRAQAGQILPRIAYAQNGQASK
jgi:hypothetical protein